MVNPYNIKPNTTEDSESTYFTDNTVLDNVPYMFLYMGIIYGVMFGVGVLVCVEAPSTQKKDLKEEKSTKQRLKDAWNFIYLDAGRTKNLYLLFLARFLFLSVLAGALAHWKTFSFTQSKNDQVGFCYKFSFISLE